MPKRFRDIGTDGGKRISFVEMVVDFTGNRIRDMLGNEYRRTIAEVGVGWHDDVVPEAQAIAHLFANSPDLYDAVKDLLECGDWVTLRPKEGKSTLSVIDAVSKLQATIRKIEEKTR